VDHAVSDRECDYRRARITHVRDNVEEEKLGDDDIYANSDLIHQNFFTGLRLVPRFR
jgi:hypothetical protein